MNQSDASYIINNESINSGNDGVDLTNANNQDNINNNENPSKQTSDVNKSDKDKLPDTGEVKNSSATLLATLLAGLGSIFLFSRRKKSNNKE
ncbi:LPXTG cell wall anchor domain-containing protein [Mammaliicoccus sciuri]|nr:LPXTG cell wall anchor domain-containing protein [Mammaliicoccus sciuri]